MIFQPILKQDFKNYTMEINTLYSPSKLFYVHVYKM